MKFLSTGARIQSARNGVFDSHQFYFECKSDGYTIYVKKRERERAGSEQSFGHCRFFHVVRIVCLLCCLFPALFACLSLLVSRFSFSSLQNYLEICRLGIRSLHFSDIAWRARFCFNRFFYSNNCLKVCNCRPEFIL